MTSENHCGSEACGEPIGAPVGRCLCACEGCDRASVRHGRAPSLGRTYGPSELAALAPGFPWPPPPVPAFSPRLASVEAYEVAFRGQLAPDQGGPEEIAAVVDLPASSRDAKDRVEGTRSTAAPIQLSFPW